MKINIQKRITTKVEIEVEFPYYFKQDLSDIREYVIYGKKIFPEKEVTIRESFNENDHPSYEIEENRFSDSCFDEKYKSNETEFEAAKSRALKFLLGL